MSRDSNSGPQSPKFDSLRGQCFDLSAGTGRVSCPVLPMPKALIFCLPQVKGNLFLSNVVLHSLLVSLQAFEPRAFGLQMPEEDK